MVEVTYSELVVKLTRKCPVCPGTLVASHQDERGFLVYYCNTCSKSLRFDPPKGVKFIRRATPSDVLAIVEKYRDYLGNTSEERYQFNEMVQELKGKKPEVKTNP